MTGPYRAHPFRPADPQSPISGPCADQACGKGYLSPYHQTPGLAGVFRGLDALDARPDGPARLDAAEHRLRALMGEVAELGQHGGRMDAATWAAWTHAALRKALDGLAGADGVDLHQMLGVLRPAGPPAPQPAPAGDPLQLAVV